MDQEEQKKNFEMGHSSNHVVSRFNNGKAKMVKGEPFYKLTTVQGDKCAITDEENIQVHEVPVVNENEGYIEMRIPSVNN